jgi:nanoRNase/pAp phosphatase (c-di-AMP/oligoRNAs hydrolase)
MSETIETRLKLLGDTLQGVNRVIILPHNDPDPDAIASAAALSYLLRHYFQISSEIQYGGIIGRSENKALTAYLGVPFALFQPQPDVPILLVDTQPNAGNNPITPEMSVSVVIDHHPLLPVTGHIPHYDVRPQLGSSATMLTQYLKAAKLDIPVTLATALFYGIKTDTLCLGRKVSPDDITAFIALQPLIDIKALHSIERAQVSAEYFRAFRGALKAARRYDDLVFAYIGETTYPDWSAEVADWLMRLEGVNWSICLGTHQGKLYISVRAKQLGSGAGQVARTIVGELGTAGGHNAMAGGQISLAEDEPVEQLVKNLRKRSKIALGISEKTVGEKLMEWA